MAQPAERRREQKAATRRREGDGSEEGAQAWRHVIWQPAPAVLAAGMVNKAPPGHSGSTAWRSRINAASTLFLSDRREARGSSRGSTCGQRPSGAIPWTRPTKGRASSTSPTMARAVWARKLRVARSDVLVADRLAPSSCSHPARYKSTASILLQSQERPFTRPLPNSGSQTSRPSTTRPSAARCSSSSRATWRARRSSSCRSSATRNSIRSRPASVRSSRL